MLDVNARSFRARVCDYTKNDVRVSTPLVIRSTKNDCDDPIYVKVDETGRTLNVMGVQIGLDQHIKTSLSSGNVSPIISENSISILRLPLPEVIEVPEDTEMVVVPNAFDLRNNARMLVENIPKIRQAVGSNVLITVLGLAEPSTLALLAYMGVDVVDDSLCTAMGMNGISLIPEGEIQTSSDVSEENIVELNRECSKIINFINGGRLRELVDQRASSSPSSVAVLRLYDRIAFDYQEESVDTVGGRFCCNTTQSLRRPDVLRYRQMILERYEKPAHKKVLVLLPCSAKKPYHTSKTHKRFSSAIHVSTYDTVVHEVIVTSPLGAVPRELDTFYPANSYDIPVTGEWKCQEKEFIRELVGHIISQGYDYVISHLGEDTELVAGLHDNIIETVVGDSTSPASLRNLEEKLREVTKGMDFGNYMIDRRETVRSVLKFQFGPEVADVLMDDDTYAIGKFPYWKLLRDKVQLGMMSEERGMFSLTIDGAEAIVPANYNIVEMMDFELKGNLFAVGVVKADPKIRIGDEAIIIKNGQVTGVGVALMSGREMMELKRGIAVKVRHKSKKQ